MKLDRKSPEYAELMDDQDSRPTPEALAVQIEEPEYIATAIAHRELTVGVKPMRYIENEGALFQGYALGYPEKVYSFCRKVWLAYEGESPKPQGWGRFIDKAEAEHMIAESVWR